MTYNPTEDLRQLMNLLESVQEPTLMEGMWDKVKAGLGDETSKGKIEREKIYRTFFKEWKHWLGGSGRTGTVEDMVMFLHTRGGLERRDIQAIMDPEGRTQQARKASTPEPETDDEDLSDYTFTSDDTDDQEDEPAAEPKPSGSERVGQPGEQGGIRKVSPAPVHAESLDEDGDQPLSKNQVAQILSNTAAHIVAHNLLAQPEPYGRRGSRYGGYGGRSSARTADLDLDNLADLDPEAAANLSLIDRSKVMNFLLAQGYEKEAIQDIKVKARSHRSLTGFRNKSEQMLLAAIGLAYLKFSKNQ